MAERPEPADVVADGVRLVVALLGAALVGYGGYLHYPPAGFISAGAMLFGVAILGQLRSR